MELLQAGLTIAANTLIYGSVAYFAIGFGLSVASKMGRKAISVEKITAQEVEAIEKQLEENWESALTQEEGTIVVVAVEVKEKSDRVVKPRKSKKRKTLAKV